MSNRLGMRNLDVTASRTVSPARGDSPGTTFTNRGATGSVTFTLIAPTGSLKGCWYIFRGLANYSFIVAAADANTLVTPGDATADNVGYQVSGKKVGRAILAYCDGTAWYAEPLGFNDGFCVDGTELPGGTLASPTLTTPTVSGGTFTGDPAFSGNPEYTGDPTGISVVKQGVLTENGAAASYTLTVPIPAGATVHDILIIPRVLWNGTSASLKVGDTADDDGFFTGVNLKATDLVVGEVLSIKESTLWGGKEGVYLVAATGRRGPTSSNFGLHYAAGSNLTFIVTPGAADGSAGRTQVVVIYSVGEVLSQVVV